MWCWMKAARGTVGMDRRGMWLDSVDVPLAVYCWVVAVQPTRMDGRTDP